MKGKVMGVAGRKAISAVSLRIGFVFHDFSTVTQSYRAYRFSPRHPAAFLRGRGGTVWVAVRR
jgi:hypothetical protein